MSDTPRVLVLHGPNLNMLGRRAPEVYGSASLTDLEAVCRSDGEALGLQVDCRQSNHEGELVEWVRADADQQRGECVLIVEGAPQVTDGDALDPAAERVLDILLTELPVKQAAALAAQITGLKKNRLYQLALDKNR